LADSTRLLREINPWASTSSTLALSVISVRAAENAVSTGATMASNGCPPAVPSWDTTHTQ